MGKFKKFLLERKLGKFYDYASSQFDLPLDISQQICDWGLKHIPDSVLGKDGRQALDDIHLTLLFGLETSYAEDLFPLIQCFDNFKITLGKISKFEKSDEGQDVIKIDIQYNERLMIMNQFLKTNLKHVETHPIYSPHITVAFVKSNSCDHLIGSSVFEGRKIEFTGVSYSSKLGEKTFIPFKIETVSPPIGKFNVLFRS